MIRLLTLLDEEIVRTPDNAALLAYRGKVFLAQGNFGAAAGDLSTALNIDKTRRRIIPNGV